MDDNWVRNEFKILDLGDRRLNKRIETICKRFADAPLSPINNACDNWAETKAAYRFFQNEKVDYREITRSHQTATVQRARANEYTLAIQDTTFMNYTPHSETTGLGVISKHDGINKKDIETKGLVMHSTIAAATDGLVLGVIDQNIYSRLPISNKKRKLKKKTHDTSLSIKEKESYKWVQALENTVAAYGEKARQVVTVADREADIYDLFLRVDQLNTNALIRAMQNRTVNRESPYSKTGEKLWDLLDNTTPLGTIDIVIPKQAKRPQRTAHCDVTVCKFTLNPSEHHYNRKEALVKDIPLYAIHVNEIDPQPDEDAIDWKLLTNLVVTTLEDALEKIKWYCLRWRIETWHKILKSGLKVEECRLSKAERLIRYLSVMSIVAWRIFWITLISRSVPEASCLIFLNDIEWKILYKKFNKNKSIPNTPPTITQAVCWIAQLGGFLARKNDGYPGNTHIWRGMKKFTTMIETVMEMKNFVGNS
jgi:hypothetical protein